MKHLKTYKLFEAQTGLTPEQEEFLNECTKGTWTYDSATGLVGVEGNFDCQSKNLEDFKGVRFGKVSGNFDCRENKLTSLAGAPQRVGYSFDCVRNKLTSLEGAPQVVGGHFECWSNELTSLEGAPQRVGGHFECRSNELTSLKGAPQKVDGDFNCSYNSLTSLEGAPKEVGRNFVCVNKSLKSLAGAPQEVGRDFACGAFKLEQGEWNLEGWLKVLKEGSQEAQSLISTILSAEYLNKEIAKDPAGMIMKLKGSWKDENFKETRSKLVWPKGYEEEADLVGDLDDLGF